MTVGIFGKLKRFFGKENLEAKTNEEKVLEGKTARKPFPTQRERENSLYTDKQPDNAGQVRNVSELKSGRYYFFYGKDKQKSEIEIIGVNYANKTIKIKYIKTNLVVEHCFADFGLEPCQTGPHKNKWKNNYLIPIRNPNPKPQFSR